ncbi:MAG: sialate O-acetylesterase [Kiritimatiellales bacterium]|jgi:hypothetical protein
MRHFRSGLLLFCLFLSSFKAGAAEPVYVGYYRGSTNVMPFGLYSFTNLTDAVGSATRIGTAGFPAASWQKMAFDGVKYLTFVRKPGAVASTNGLYECDGNKGYMLISSNADTGVYAFTNWHGIGYCNPNYYGLYNGTGMSGPGLYRFTDPTDPESTAVHLFPSQTFPSNTWNDFDFDGTRYLFAKTAAEGDPGIYQYDPQADTFTRISGAETYTNWDGLGVYVEPPPAPPSTNTALLHKKIYVILFGGQSNAVGWGYHQYLLDTGDPLADPQSDVDFYSYTSILFPNTLTVLQSGTGQPRFDAPKTNTVVLQYPSLTNAPISRFGPELSLGRTVRDRIRIPNSKVAVIKCAFAGTSLYSGWLPDGTTNSATDGSCYRNFQITARNGLAALQAQYPDYEIEILGMGWVQGESDTANGQSTNYFKNLTNFIADVRANYGTNLVFALSKLSPNQNTTTAFDTVRAAQQAAADADPRVVATETIGTDYPTCNGFTEGKVHYGTVALLQIGRDLGNAIIDASGLDSDNDGLPDAWENSYGPGAAGLGTSPSADYDGDGLTDLQEFQIGTDPTNPDDSLKLTSAQLRARWPAKKDVRYQMLTSTNLTSWTDFGDPVLLRDGNGTVEMDFSQYVMTNHSAFFRLQVR